MKETLIEQIKEAVLSFGFVSENELPTIMLEVPREKAHGDWATNIAMQLTKKAKKNPRVIAQEIVEKIDQEKAMIQKVEIAGPGFINFFMDRSFLTNILQEMKEAGSSYGRTDAGKGQTINVEFCSANPTGHLHLGHARGSAVGDSLCNILDTAGYQVTREYYINDAGNQMNMMALSLEARILEGLGQEVEFPEDGYRGQEIIHIAQELIQSQGDQILAMSHTERIHYLKEIGRKKLLDKIESDLGKYRVKFDVWFSERSLYESGAVEETVEALKKGGYTYEQDGALWLKSTQFGDDKDRVLIKNDGSYTYLTPDIAYHRNKLSRGHQQLINIWGADHHGYISRIKAGLAALGHNPDQLEIIITQMVKLYQGGELVKMSKRTGKAITLNELLDEVGIDATRYFFSMRSPDTHLDFDMDLAVSQTNENPVYYLQYAYARICSVFRQAEAKGVAPSWEANILKLLQEEQELDLIQKLGEFPGEIASAAGHRSPHRVIRYLFDLATQFHSYYNACHFLTDQREQSQARLTLITGVAQVIRNGLKLVGVEAPERM
ncbi:arginine--tRNA ligase [Hazenella coriacea]|nr:arginine--tRNA ligase [Hazenella coriacea]